MRGVRWKKKRSKKKMLEMWNYFLNFQESNASRKKQKIVEKKMLLNLPKHLLLSLLQKYSLLLQRQTNQQ